MSRKNLIKEVETLLEFPFDFSLPTFFLVTLSNTSSWDKNDFVKKPFCKTTSQIFDSVALKLHQEIPSVSFCWITNRQILFVSRDSSSNWLKNNKDVIISYISSLATLEFNKYCTLLNINPIPAIITVKSFSLPVETAVKYIVAKQEEQILKCKGAVLKYLYKESLNKKTHKQIEEFLEEKKYDFDKFPENHKYGREIIRIKKNHFSQDSLVIVEKHITEIISSKRFSENTEQLFFSLNFNYTVIKKKL